MSSIHSMSTRRSIGSTYQGARKVLATLVRVIGRFLLTPDEIFDLGVAEQLIRRAKSNRVRIQTVLKVFNSGFRLGERGFFATMPVEFIEFGRLRALVSPPTEPATLAACISAHHQRYVIVMQFKNANILISVADEIKNQLNLAASRTESVSSVAVRRDNRRVADWAGEQTGSIVFDETVHPDYAVIRKPQQRQQQQQQQQQRQQQPNTAPAPEIVLNDVDHPDYAVIRRPQEQEQTIEGSTEEAEVANDIDVEILNYDEIGSVAVFETPNGPPSVLNDPLPEYAVKRDAAFGSVTVRNSRPFSEDFEAYATVAH